VAPPLVKGRALLQRRVAGIVFLAVLGMLVQSSIWIYQKKFTPVVEVSLQAGRAGNQLSTHADVKIRGVVVGEVREVRSTGDGAVLRLALQPERATLVPREVKAQLLPKTLFGEKEVVLVATGAVSGDHLRDGDVITQDRSSTALETETALNNALPVLRALQPEKLSLALSALSQAVRDRGDLLGANFAANAAYFRALNPKVPTIGDDFGGLADLVDTVSTATPDLLAVLDNFAASSRSLVEEKAALDAFLRRTSDFASTARTFVAQNEARLEALANDSLPSLQLYDQFSSMYACMLNRIAFAEIEGERVFGGAQPGLHITIEVTRDAGGFAPGDEPQYKEGRNFACFGLGTTPIRPFPEFANAQDGYHDDEPAKDAGEGPGGCCQKGARSWYGPVAAPAAASPSRSLPMPRRTSVLDALLLAPILGNG
jgi:virulence factor Mce-like protein